MVLSKALVEQLAREGYEAHKVKVPLDSEGDPRPLFSDLSDLEQQAWQDAVTEIVENYERQKNVS